MMPSSASGPTFDTAAGPRIACLATQAGRAGGAAIALDRLVTALKAAGGRVSLLTRDDLGPSPAACRRLERRVRRVIRAARTPLSNTLFTADWPAWTLATQPLVAAADVVNLHWVAGLLNAAGIRAIARSGRPVIWTLHDMRPFTGGCHYASGCEGFTSGCRACPQLSGRPAVIPSRVAARGRRALAGVPLTFVPPTRWLAGELRRSRLFDPAAHQIHVIPNGIDLNRYKPACRAVARRRLGLPEEGLGILLGSVSLAERRKAAPVAAAAVARAAAARGHRPAGPGMFAITYGSGTLSIPGLPCRHLGSVAESGVLAALQACDVHLTMAREDNLPNTVMEAMACGRPVIATAAGGHPEMLADGCEGWLVGIDDAAAAAAAIVRLLESPELLAAAGVRARRRAEAAWDVTVQARRYLTLAADLHAATGTSRPAEPWRPASVAGLTPAAAVAVHRGGPLRGPLRRLRRLGRRVIPATP